MSKGTEFERLVAFLERIVNDLPSVEVLHNVKMPARYGGKRQIDILINDNRGRFTYKTIIECKNANSKVEVNTVGAFKELIETVGVHQGIIVSAAGFQSGAILSAKEANVHLYQLSQVEELEKHLKEQCFISYKIKHTSESITIMFKEKKAINQEITLYTKIFAPILNKKISIADIAQDCLNKMQGKIVNELLAKSKDPLKPQITGGNTEFKIHFPSAIIFANRNEFTEIIGFDAKVKTQIFSAPSAIKNISEYKDIVREKIYVLMYEVEYDGKTYKLLKAEKQK